MTNISSTPSSAPTAIPKPPDVYGYVSGQDTARKIAGIVIDPRTNTVVHEFMSGEGLGMDIVVAQQRGMACVSHAVFAAATVGYFSIIDTTTIPPSLATTIIDPAFAPNGQGLQVEIVSNNEVWVANYSNIIILDPSKPTTPPDVLTFPGYTRYFCVAYVPLFDEIYVAVESELFVIDRASRTIKSTITLSPPSAAIISLKLTLDQTRLYMARTKKSSPSGPNDVAVVDTTTHRQIPINPIPIKFDIEDLAITPDGKRVYLADGSALDNSTILLIDTATHTVTHSIRVLSHVRGIAVTPDNRYLYCSGYNLKRKEASVQILDTLTDAFTASIPLNPKMGPNHIDFGPPVSSTFYVNEFIAMADSDAVEIRTSSGPKTVVVGKTPIGIAVAPEGRRAYVCNKDDDSVSVIELFNHSVLRTISLGAGTSPLGIAISPDSAFAYVACTGTSEVKKINLHNFVVTPIAVSGMPRNVVIHPDNGLVYVSCWNKHSVTVIDPMVGVIYEMFLKDPPFGMALSPLNVLYVCSGDSVKIVPTASVRISVANEISIGGFPFAIAMSPDGLRAYVTNIGDNSVYVIELFTGVVHPPIAVGRFPFSIAVHPSNREVRVVNSSSKTITTLDASTLTPIATDGPFPSRLGEIALANLWTLVYE